MSTPSGPAASIIISTKNRREDLRKAVHSAVAQSVSVEILVMDDGSTDGTPDMIRSEFPQVRLERSEVSLGYIVQRNRGAALASTPIIFIIDDNATLSPHTVAQTLPEFNHPRVGAVAIPLVEVVNGPEIRGRAPDADHVYVTGTYIGTSHALRRDLFLAMGGYHEYLHYIGEEADYCQRLPDAGFICRMGRAEPIYHFWMPSNNRSEKKQAVFRSRNHVLAKWYNVPFPELLIHWAGTSLHLVQHGLKQKQTLWHLQGLARGYAASLHEWRRRRPIRRVSLRLGRTIARRRPLLLSEIESQLPKPILPPLAQA